MCARVCAQRRAKRTEQEEETRAPRGSAPAAVGPAASLARPGLDPAWRRRRCCRRGGGMERFMALLRLLSRRRRGRRYRADDDYQEGYEDVYYYTSKYSTHLLSEWGRGGQAGGLKLCEVTKLLDYR